MLSEEQIAAGWKPHDGGECPVPWDTLVDVMFADGYVIRGRSARLWDYSKSWWRWEGRSQISNIIAYREHRNDA